MPLCVGGFPVGFGEAVEGTLKNHIPEGLRRVLILQVLLNRTKCY